MEFHRLPFAEAVRRLQGVLPEVNQYSIGLIVPALERRGRTVEFQPIPNWYDYPRSDEVIFRRTIAQLPAFTGPLVANTFVTDTTGHDPFEVPAGCLSEFVLTHRQRFGWVFFNSDAVIFSPEQKRFFLVHHNGVCVDAWL